MIVTKLLNNEVFVFGSNAQGFHGAGAAGLACRGDSRNNWRSDSWFVKASQSPPGSPDRIGKWAIYGQARGYQEGSEGRSYAIMSCLAPGWRRSVPLQTIQDQFVELFAFARNRPELRFLLSPVGTGLAGYSLAEIEATIDKSGQHPDNIILTWKEP